jgi:hypothetical protein
MLSEHYQFQAQVQGARSQEQRIALYQKALAVDPYNFSAAAELGSLFYGNHDPHAALPYLAYGVQHGINNIFNHATLSFAYAQTGQYDRASAALQAAVEAYPGTIFARLLYAEALTNEGKLAAANEQRAVMRAINAEDAAVWELVLERGFKAAALIAQQQKLPHPAQLEPRIGLGVIQERERLTQRPYSGFRLNE